MTAACRAAGSTEHTVILAPTWRASAPYPSPCFRTGACPARTSPNSLNQRGEIDLVPSHSKPAGLLRQPQFASPLRCRGAGLPKTATPRRIVLKGTGERATFFVQSCSPGTSSTLGALARARLRFSIGERWVTQSLAAIALLVRDDDEAIEFFTACLGFVLAEDTAPRASMGMAVHPRRRDAGQTDARGGREQTILVDGRQVCRKK